MYRIICDGQVLYDPRIDDLVILEGKVKQGLNCSSVLDFAIPPSHPLIGAVRKMASVLEVWDNELCIFRGRPCEERSDMRGIMHYHCESELGYLLDSIQRPEEYHNLTPRKYLEAKLAQHNAQVPPNKQFHPGIVDIETMNYDAREDNQYTDTLHTILDKLVASNGGYLRVRHENGERYLDYVQHYGKRADQAIEFGVNLLDLEQYINTSDIITTLIPLGAALVDENGEQTGKKLTIASVNGGKDYIDNGDAIVLYDGRITAVHEWQDVTDPNNLLRKAREYLQNAANLHLSITVSAVDLHMVDQGVGRLMMGDEVRIISPLHRLDRWIEIAKREYDLLDPRRDTITLGEMEEYMSDIVRKTREALKKQQPAVERVYTMANKVDKVSGAMGQVEQTVAELGGKVQTVESDTSNLGGRVAEVENANAAIRENLEKLQQHDAETDIAVADLSRRLADAEKRIAELKA